MERQRAKIVKELLNENKIGSLTPPDIQPSKATQLNGILLMQDRQIEPRNTPTYTTSIDL